MLLSFIWILCPQCLVGEPFCNIPQKTSEVSGNGHHMFLFPYYHVTITPSWWTFSKSTCCHFDELYLAVGLFSLESFFGG